MSFSTRIPLPVLADNTTGPCPQGDDDLRRNMNNAAQQKQRQNNSPAIRRFPQLYAQSRIWAETTPDKVLIAIPDRTIGYGNQGAASNFIQ
jgi:hypothetical protein